MFLLLIHIINLYFTFPEWKYLVQVKDSVSFDTQGHGVREQGKSSKKKSKSKNSMCNVYGTREIFRMKTSK